MHKNRMLQLAQISERSDRIGSKLKVPLMIETTEGEFDLINKKIDKFINNTQQANELRNQYMKAVNPTKKKELADSINIILNKSQKMVHPIQEEIKRIDLKYKEQFENGDKSNYYKVSAITKKARDAISELKKAQEKFSSGVKDTIRRHATIIQGDITEEEVEEVINSPEKGEEMLKAKLLNSPSVQLESAVSDIMDNQRGYIEGQKQNMNECLEMTRELALLVQIQGQKLNNIEVAIDQTGDYMQKAEEDLIKAKEHHKSSKKKMCCIIVLILIAIGAILIPVLLTQL